MQNTIYKLETTSELTSALETYLSKFKALLYFLLHSSYEKCSLS